MPLVLSKNPALLVLQPLAAEVEDNKPPVINTYSPEVEKWRQDTWDRMPQQLKMRPDAAMLLDKALYTNNGESSGNDSAVGDGGAAWGGWQSHHIPAGSDRNTQIDDMWRLVSNNPDQWTDWGEGATYEGKSFGALGRAPYNGGSGGNVTGNTAGQVIGSSFAKGANPPDTQSQLPKTPILNFTSDTDTQGYPAIQKTIGNTTGGMLSSPVNPDTGGVDQNYGPFDTRQGSDYVDAPSGSPRAQLEAERQGQDQLGNAALAGAVALPIIGAGPIAGPLGVVGGSVGQSIDEKLNLPQANVPLLGKVGPATLVGGALGGVGETALAPNAIERAGSSAIAPGRAWQAAVKPPKLRLVQPGETPGVLSIAGKPDPQDFLAKARAMGMSDEEIRSAFPGALEAGSGINTGPQVAARTDTEQAAKGAAARRTYNKVYQDYYDELARQGYSDAEAKQIATRLASKDARTAAAQAPEALPRQRENVPYSEETASEMQKAQEQLRNPGNAIAQEPLPALPTNDALTAEADRLENIGGTARSSTDQTLADIAEGAKRIGDPASELRRQLQGQSKNQLKQAIEEEEQKGKRRTPEENAALRAARTAGPDNPPETLQDILNKDTKRFEPPTDNPNAQPLDMSGQGGQMGVSEATDYTGPKPEAGASLETQRLNRGLQDQAKLPGEGEVVEAAKNLKTDQQASLLNKDWEPGKSIAQSAGRAMSDLISLPRSLQTRFDFSYPFRQGLLFVRRQGEFWDAFGKGVQSLWKDEEWKRAVEAEYMNAPYNPQTLKLTRWSGGNMADREELFYNRLIDKFPAPMRKVFDASEEAATIFINKLRSDVTNNVARKWLRNGLEATDPEFIQDLNIFGNYVNRATGYGNLGELEKSVGLLNTVFYGARRNISMVQAPGYLFNSSGRVRVEAWKDFMGLFGMGASTLGLAQLAGIGDVNTFNPDSADWGKLKIGDTRLDIWGGYQQTARLIYKVVNGEMKSPGDLSVFWKNVLPYLGNKLSPQAGAAVSTMPEGVKSAIQPVDRPFKLTDALAPLAWQGLVQAVKEDGAVAGAIAATGLVGIGTQTYETQTDVRDKAAGQLGLGKYEDLTPAQRQQVDQTEAVKKYQQENSSAYKQDKERRLAPINQEETKAIEAFKQGTLTKKLPDIWHDQGIARRQVALDLADQYKDMFAGFDKSRFDSAVEGYYSQAKQAPDGQMDFDATEAARQDYLKTLKPDEKQWLDEALGVTEGNKSEAHQRYDKYIAERKTAGYFKSDITPEQKLELNKANPLQDALNWYWNGGTQDTSRVPRLNTAEGASIALQLAPSRPVTYSGLSRPVNADPGSLQAWKDYSERIDSYFNKAVPAYQESEAKALFKKDWAALDNKQQQSVRDSIMTKVRNGSPDLEAALQYFGHTKEANGVYIVSAKAGPELEKMIQRYGANPPQPNTSWAIRGR